MRRDRGERCGLDLGARELGDAELRSRGGDRRDGRGLDVGQVGEGAVERHDDVRDAGGGADTERERLAAHRPQLGVLDALESAVRPTEDRERVAVRGVEVGDEQRLHLGDLLGDGGGG